MTNNPTIDGVSRELLERILHGCMFTLSRQQYGELRALLDADKVNNREIGLMQFVEAHPIAPAVERQEPKTSQVPVLRAMAANYRNGHSWDFLDGEAVSKAADEITALQSTIAQLQARIGELESGRGEPFMYGISQPEGLPHFSEFCVSSEASDLEGEVDSMNDEGDGLFRIVALYTAPPAPVAVVLPERKPVTAGLLSESNTHNQGWNACIDATAALNNKPSTEVNP